MHPPPQCREAMVPARPRLPPRQRAWPASGCHGPGVQLRPACPLWNNGEACWVVLGVDGWHRDRSWETTPRAGRRSREERLRVFLRRSWIPQGPRSEISFRCVWGGVGDCWTREFKIQKMGPGSHLFWGPKTPAKRYLRRPGSGGCSGWAERRHSGDPP